MSAQSNETLLGRGGDLVRWDKLIKAMSAVCNISFINDNDECDLTPVSIGCGSLVQRIVHGDNITAILTDSQVIHSKESAKKVMATFRCDSSNETIIIHLQPDIFFQCSQEFEFTLVGVRPEDSNTLLEKLRIKPLQLKRITQRDVYNLKTVQIAQYPDGDSKWLSLARVCEIKAKYIVYNADTAACCSGSPVFYACNDDCYVIALHKSNGKEGKEANRGLFINHVLDLLYGDRVELLQPESKPIFTPREISRIGRKLSSKWEKIALASGKFKVEETENIRHNSNHDDVVMKATVMLNEYEKKQGTREDLASAIKEFGDLDLAGKVSVKYFQTHAD